MPITETREERIRRLAREEETGERKKRSRRPRETRADYLRRLAREYEYEDGVRKAAAVPPRRFTPSPHSVPLPPTVHRSDPMWVRSGVEKALGGGDAIDLDVEEALATPPAPREITTISEARQFLHDVSDATQRHRTQRIGTDAGGRSVTVTDREEGGASTIVPAASIAQLQAQVSRLISAFREVEGRDPGPDDAGFWLAYKQVLEAFASAQRGSSQRAEEPLNTDAPTGATPPVQGPGDHTAPHARTPVRK